MENETLIKAEQTADLLCADLLEAHNGTENVAMQLMLMEMIDETRRVQRKLKGLTQ